MGERRLGAFEEGGIGLGSDSLALGVGAVTPPRPWLSLWVCHSVCLFLFPFPPLLLLSLHSSLSPSRPSFSPWHLPSLALPPSPRRDQTGIPPCPSMPVPGRPCRLLPSQYSSLFLTSVPNSALLALTPCPGPPLFLPPSIYRVLPPRGAISTALAVAPLHPGQHDDPTV